jgi:transposase
MAPRTPYPPDLTDKEWTLIAPSGPTAKPGGRPEKSPPRDILDAIFSILRRGCAWRLLPHDCPPWQIVYPYCWRWQHAGTWQRMPDLLRGDVRVAAGKRRQLSAGIIDRQSVKTTETGGATATTRPHMSTAAHGTSSSTLSGCSSRSWSRPPACQTATGPWPCWTPCGTAVLACA